MKIKPLETRILVEPEDTPTQTKSGLYLPETSKDLPQSGIVLAVGDDCTHVKKGDRIIFSKYSGTELNDIDAVSKAKRRLIVMSEGDVLATYI